MPPEPTVSDEPDRGAVTVEAAFATCSIVVVAVLVLGAFGLALGHVRSADAAIEAARLVARGDARLAHDAVTELGPAGASLTVSVRGAMVTTEVNAKPFGLVVPEQWCRARALAVLEPGVEVPESVS
ncbi:hypothetical protein GIY23_01495 [Allosaccharopolyspora coralli]|uniref:Pilus assembly protein TadE n=1 Tax=Allosaccharopolyspora coralli TaxID=2665642 RepID=A0A5Q3QAB1_9PSEU|nr:TadE family type IV pilus minor pilin [Allosaccharopolyspora coralli]QGK68405.1 hypothetical protein GIY23_01495 [Allosaccharopolyspora coralli]